MTRIVADDQTHAQITPDELQKSADTSKWFVENIKIPPQAQDLPEKYSGYAPKQILPEVSSLVSNVLHIALPALFKCVRGYIEMDH